MPTSHVTDDICSAHINSTAVKCSVQQETMKMKYMYRHLSMTRVSRHPHQLALAGSHFTNVNTGVAKFAKTIRMCSGLPFTLMYIKKNNTHTLYTMYLTYLSCDFSLFECFLLLASRPRSRDLDRKCPFLLVFLNIYQHILACCITSEEQSIQST